jgi:hypothetical protein
MLVSADEGAGYEIHLAWMRDVGAAAGIVYDASDALPLCSSSQRKSQRVPLERAITWPTVQVYGCFGRL